MAVRITGVALAIGFFRSAAAAEPLCVPFDFSRGSIGLHVNVKGVPLFMILDTGVDPSVIDLSRADALGLKVDRAAGGEATGGGDAKQARAFPVTLSNLTISGRPFASFDALAMDMGILSETYGRALDGVLGYSFLADKVVLVDYANRTVGVLDGPADAATLVRACGSRWSIPMRSYEGDSIPVVPRFRFGTASAPISLDTGSNGGIALYQSALDLPGVRAALSNEGETSYSGARGDAKTKTYLLNAPVGFGPFTLPAGEIVTLRTTKGSIDTRVANVGNKLFAEMKLKMLLDYRNWQVTFFGDCR